MALKHWSSCRIYPAGVEFFVKDSPVPGKVIHIDTAGTHVTHGMHFSRTLFELQKAHHCDVVTTDIRDLPNGYVSRRLQRLADFWSQLLRGARRDPWDPWDLELLRYATHGWQLPFQVSPLPELHTPVSTSGKPPQHVEDLLEKLFVAIFSQATGAVDCRFRVRLAAGHALLQLLGPVFHALLVEAVRMVCLIETKNYHVNSLGSREPTLLIGADDSLRWLQRVLRSRWSCPQMLFLGLHAVPLQWSQDVVQLDKDVQAFRSDLRHRWALGFQRRFQTIYFLPLGVTQAQQPSAPHGFFAILPLLHKWLINDHRNCSLLVRAFLAVYAPEDHLMVETPLTANQTMRFRHITGVGRDSFYASWTSYHLQDWRPGFVHRPFLGNWTFHAAHLWGCPSCARHMGPALTGLTAVRNPRTFLDGHDLRTSTAVDLRWQLKRSLDMTAPFYNDVSVLLSFPHSGSRVVSLLMETLSARPAYSLYEHRLSRHGWCKWTQPFGLLSHVACDEEPSVVRHHGINFYESVNPDVAYGLIVILRDYGDHIAEEVAFGRSLGLFELTDFLKNYISTLLFFRAWEERKLLIYYDQLVKKLPKVVKRLGGFWRVNVTWWTLKYQSDLEEKMSEIPGFEYGKIFSRARRKQSLSTPKAELRWTDTVLDHLRSLEELMCNLYPEAFREHLWHPEWHWGSGSAPSCIRKRTAPGPARVARNHHRNQPSLLTPR